MRSTNPVFTRSEPFNAPSATYYGQPPYGQPPYGQPMSRAAMTIDDVITKSAITMGVLVLSAAATFMVLMKMSMPVLIGTLMISGIVGFVTVLLVSMRRVVNPAFVLAYSVVEGIFIGAFTLLFASLYDLGLVAQAVVGTFVAAGVTLFAYRFFNIKVTAKFRKIVTLGTFAFLGLVLVNCGLSLVNINLGIRTIGGGFNFMAVLVSLVAIGLCIANLIMDFDHIEQGVRNQLPSSESWRAAFGLTVTMVWLYTELLRILSYFRN